MARAQSSAGDLPPPLRFPLLALGFIALGLGILAGLSRIGWSVYLPSAALPALHGALMVSGFFGIVIGLERAVALGRRWAYLGPLASGLGTLLLVTGAPLPLGIACQTLGASVLLAATMALHRRQPALHTRILALGSGCWLAGNLLWAGNVPLAGITPWWMAFLVLTIAAERLELSRLLKPTPLASRTFIALIALVIVGTTLSLMHRSGWWIVGVGHLGLALWLLTHDVARRTVRQQGLTRFIAACLLSGYVWLAISGVLLCLPGAALGAGSGYDAALHAVFIGFVFSMVFGHAPIIFPAVTQLRVPYNPVFYFPLLLLHVSLALRLIGDLMVAGDWRSRGGLINAVALVLFVLNTLVAIVRGRLRD